MHKLTDQKTFEKGVLAMTKQKNAKLFHCYVAGDIFKIATAAKVQEFDFSSINDAEAVKYILAGIEILKENLPKRVSLLS